MWAKRLGAYANLAVHFWQHVVLAPFTKRRGLDIINREFFADGILPVTVAARTNAPAANRCNGCGACDRLASTVSPSLVLLRLGREGADAAAAARLLDPLRPIAASISCLCPERVDVSGLISRLDQQAVALGLVEDRR